MLLRVTPGRIVPWINAGVEITLPYKKRSVFTCVNSVKLDYDRLKVTDNMVIPCV
jgi:hypothetical protein